MPLERDGTLEQLLKERAAMSGKLILSQHSRQAIAKIKGGR